MDKCFMTRVHCMVNKELCYTFTTDHTSKDQQLNDIWWETMIWSHLSLSAGIKTTMTRQCGPCTKHLY
jgi:hypothetical protein